jgi:hypothetical protein
MDSDEENTGSRNGSLKGFWLGMLFGILTGFGVGMLWTPFEGILKLSAHVHLMTFFLWSCFAFIGGIAGCFVGALIHGFLLERRRQQNVQNG